MTAHNGEKPEQVDPAQTPDQSGQTAKLGTNLETCEGLHIYPKKDTNDGDPVRMFMIVDETGGTVAVGKPFEWQIRKHTDQGDNSKVEWGPLPEQIWEPLHPENSAIRLNTGRIEKGYYDIRAVRRRGQVLESSEHSLVQVKDLPPVAFVSFTGSAPGPVVQPTPVAVTLGRAHVPPTKDEILWIAIRASTNQLHYDVYEKFVEAFLARRPPHKRGNGNGKGRHRNEWDLAGETAWMVSNYGPYRVLKFATEVFVMTRCGVIPGEPLELDLAEEEARFGHTLPKKFEEMWSDYLIPIASEGDDGQALILPYLDIIRRKLGDLAGPRATYSGIVDDQCGYLQSKLVFPCMLELIWSYWHEEGMLVQTMNAITQRFQNVRGPNGRDPLANLEIDPLRPLSQLLWGFVQDEPNRLSVLRRGHEYDHHYGFTLHGKVMKDLRTIDRRSKFLESFHNLLHRCTKFYREDDDTTVVADGFPVLNAIKETHYVLAHGAHNQFGDLPAGGRQEMLMQQYILSRPEMREFLGGRVMVPYPERWMDRVDAVKMLKGWTDASVVHFRDLAVFGEQIVLSIRYGAWSLENTPHSAANWARYWRAEIQGYIHAYRAVTGIDLTAELTDQRQATERYLPPSVHLRNRLLTQQAVK
ncbi:hypothetical protein LVJ94_22025 [Pendulispora rubella]|uniref:8-amino-7-oxononanoate synthase n=1 Tax=Pendulispora rubella TaxID=2741070 RepID=A0ABZ2LG36_9BACT